MKNVEKIRFPRIPIDPADPTPLKLSMEEIYASALIHGPELSSSDASEKLLLAQKVFEEKRKRNQAYHLLDYQLSLISYFDFFSHDAFLVAKNSRYIASIYGKKTVDTSSLLLSLLSHDSNLKLLLTEFKIDLKKVGEIISERNEKRKQKKTERELQEFGTPNISFRNFFSKDNREYLWKYINFHFKPIKNVTTFLKKEKLHVKEIIEKYEEITEPIDRFLGYCPNPDEVINLQKEIPFSRELSLLFEKAADNAITRFKTPVITSELLFLTLLESKTSTNGKLLDELLGTRVDWNLLRYRLLKKLHASELTLRTEVVVNQHFFAYLLKTQLPEKEYQALIDKKLLGEGVSFFRDNLLKLTMEKNLSELLEKDIYRSMKFHSPRKYKYPR
jgi:hypothetical protein